MTFAHSAEVVALTRKLNYWRDLAKQLSAELDALKAELNRNRLDVGEQTPPEAK